MSVVVKYIDLDNNSAELASSEELNGKAGERIKICPCVRDWKKRRQTSSFSNQFNRQ